MVSRGPVNVPSSFRLSFGLLFMELCGSVPRLGSSLFPPPPPLPSPPSPPHPSPGPGGADFLGLRAFSKTALLRGYLGALGPSDFIFSTSVSSAVKWGLYHLLQASREILCMRNFHIITTNVYGALGEGQALFYTPDAVISVSQKQRYRVGASL